MTTSQITYLGLILTLLLTLNVAKEVLKLLKKGLNVAAKRKGNVSFKWHKIPPYTEGINWLESDIQSYIVHKLREWQEIEPDLFLFNADASGVNLTPRLASKMKLLGMESGVPDLTFLVSRGRVVFIELKRKGGRVSPDQTKRHEAMAMLGFKVYVVVAKTPQHGWDQVYEIMKGEV